MAHPEQPIPTPPSQRLEDFRRRVLPMIVWGVAVLVAAVLLFQRTQQFDYIGIAQAFEYEVSVMAHGTLDSVTVELFDDVQAGSVVARMDDAPLLAALETERATIKQLAAQLEAERTHVTSGVAGLNADLRRFQADEESRRLGVLAQRVVVESEQVELERLSLAERRHKALLEDEVISQALYDNIYLERERVRKSLDQNRTLLDQSEQELQVARVRRQEYEAELPLTLPDEESVLRPLHDAITVEERRIDEIEVQRRATYLRSPVAGQVTQVLCRRGQAVVPGEPILTVAEHSPREIVAYLRESGPAAPRGGSRVLVSSARVPQQAAESLVLRVGGTVQPLPQRLWTDPRVPEHGRAVVIANVSALDLVPGERVSVRFLPDS